LGLATAGSALSGGIRALAAVEKRIEHLITP
jgi:hypothetical protein